MRFPYPGEAVRFANSNHADLTRGRFAGNGAGELYRFPLRGKELACSPANALDSPSVVGMIDMHTFEHEIPARL